MTTDVLNPDRAQLTVEAEPARQRNWFRTCCWALALLASVAVLYPIVLTVLDVLGVGSGTSQLGRIFGTLFQLETLRLTLNTLIAVGAGGGLALVVGAVLAWANERTDARMGFAAKSLPLIPMFVPSIAGAIGWVFLASESAGFLNVLLRNLLALVGVHLTEGPLNIYSWPGLIFAYFLFLTPYAYLTISSGLQSLDPTLEEASRSSGAGAFTTFRRVTLPSLRPALGASILLLATMGFAIFSIPMVIGTPAGIDVLPVRIVHMVKDQYPNDTAGALGLSLVIVAVIGASWLAQRAVVRRGNFATISGRGSMSSAVPLGRWKWGVRLLMLGFMFLTAVLPFLGLVAVSTQGFWSANFSFSKMSLKNYGGVLDKELVWGGLTNSLVMAAVGATVALLLGAVIVNVVEARKSRIGRAVDGIVKLPATLSHVIIALAFIVAFAGDPFNLIGTPTILILAYIVMYLPQATFYATAAYHQVGRQLVEASKTSGASEGSTFRRVLLPLMAPGLIGGWALVFVLITGDITASAMLAGTHTPVIGFVILDLWTAGTFPALAALAVMMTLVSSLVVLTVMWGRDRFRLVR